METSSYRKHADRMMLESLTALEQSLRRRLSGPLPGAAAQRRFAPAPEREGWRPEMQPHAARHAAAIILLYPHDGAPHLPLTIRHHALPQHAGQVSLPGGAIDPGESVERAARREAEEEIGVPADTVRVLGTLSTLWVPVSNFVIHPVVGIVDQTPVFHVHPHEVTAVVDVPLATLRDASIVGWERRVVKRPGLASQDPVSSSVMYRCFRIAGHTVWGATAMILSEFVALCDDEGPLVQNSSLP